MGIRGKKVIGFQERRRTGNREREKDGGGLWEAVELQKPESC